MSWKIKKSAFEIAVENLRQQMEYLRYELRMPEETIRLQTEAILRSFVVRDMAEARRWMPEDGS